MRKGIITIIIQTLTEPYFKNKLNEFQIPPTPKQDSQYK